MLKCDEEGIPKLVQRISYGDMAWELKLFSGQTVLIDDDVDLPRAVKPTDDAMLLDIEQRFTSTIHPHIKYTDILDATPMEKHAAEIMRNRFPNKIKLQ